MGLKEYWRRKKHHRFLLDSVLEMRNKFTNYALRTGKIDKVSWHLFHKYNNRLRDWEKNN